MGARGVLGVCLSACIEGSQKIVLEVEKQAECRPENVTGGDGGGGNV